MFTSLNLGFAAGAADRGVREKSLMIFVILGINIERHVTDHMTSEL